MILFADSYDFGNPLHISGNSNLTVPSCKYVQNGSSFNEFPSEQLTAGLGGGLAIRFPSSSFGQQTLTKMLDEPMDKLCSHFFYRALGSELGGTGSVLIRFEDADTDRFGGGGNSATRLMLFGEASDNTLSIYTEGQGTSSSRGTLLWNSAGVFTITFETWMCIEIMVDTAAGAWALWINDDLLQSQSVALPGPIDRYSFRSESFEAHDIDHHYLTDGEHLGPCYVNGFAPSLQSTHQWTPANDTNLSQIEEFGNRPDPLQTPDDDVSFNFSGVVGNFDLFGFPPQNCYGRILALALNADGRYVLPGSSVDLITKIGANLYDVGFPPAFDGLYSIRQAISELNPATGEVWNDGTIPSSLFGYRLAGSGSARITQFMLEKVVSLRVLPFTCGQGSYSFTS